MLRRRRSDAEREAAPPPSPEWQRRFDEAVALLQTRPQPDWVGDRIGELQRSLTDADASVGRLQQAIDQLDADQTARDLETALRAREAAPPGSPAASDRRVDALRQRWETVNEMINRRESIEARMLDAAADVELLAVRAVRSDALEGETERELDEHFARLEVDLRALEQARREVDEL